MAIPCPSCRQPLGLTIDFIMKHPVSQCPYCLTVMDFKPDTKIVGEYKSALKQIEDIQKKYKNVAKFG